MRNRAASALVALGLVVGLTACGETDYPPIDQTATTSPASTPPPVDMATLLARDAVVVAACGDDPANTGLCVIDLSTGELTRVLGDEMRVSQVARTGHHVLVTAGPDGASEQLFVIGDDGSMGITSIGAIGVAASEDKIIVTGGGHAFEATFDPDAGEVTFGDQVVGLEDAADPFVFEIEPDGTFWAVAGDGDSLVLYRVGAEIDRFPVASLLPGGIRFGGVTEGSRLVALTTEGADGSLVTTFHNAADPASWAQPGTVTVDGWVVFDEHPTKPGKFLGLHTNCPESRARGCENASTSFALIDPLNGDVTELFTLDESFGSMDT